MSGYVTARSLDEDTFVVTDPRFVAPATPKKSLKWDWLLPFLPALATLVIEVLVAAQERVPSQREADE